MPRTCTACTHPHRDEIDRLLLDGAALRNIAKRYSLSAASLFRISPVDCIALTPRQPSVCT
jgi:hypothetical protein